MLFPGNEPLSSVQESNEFLWVSTEICLYSGALALKLWFGKHLTFDVDAQAEEACRPHQLQVTFKSP